MAYFPFFVELKGLRCLIAGGGAVAVRKAFILAEYEPKITVVSPDVLNLLSEDGRFQIVMRRFEESDLQTADFVIAATDDREENQRIAHLCQRRRIPVNSADSKEDSSFLFPALVRDGEITIGISTSGNSPVIARYLKDLIGSMIPDGLGQMTAQLGQYRQLIRQRIADLPKRSRLFNDLAKHGMEHGYDIRQDMAETLIQSYLDDTKATDGSDQNHEEGNKGRDKA